MYVTDDPDGQLLVAKASTSFAGPREPVEPRRRPQLGSFDYSFDWWNRDFSEYFGIPSEQESVSSYPAMDDSPGGFAGYGDLGIAPAVLVPIGTKLVGGLLNPHPQDPQRYAANQSRYQAAIAGDQASLEALLSSSGQYGQAEWDRLYPGRPMPNTAWATDGPRQDSFAKYQQAKQLLASRGAPLVSAGVPGSPNQPGPVDAGLFSGLAQGGLTTYLLLGGLVAYVASQRGGRRRR